MHETMVAQSMLDTILAEAEKINLRPLSATVSCGQLNPINDEVLTFAFDAAANGTVCKGMKINVIHNTLKANCTKCDHTFDFDIYSPFCDKCKNEDINIQPDALLLLEEIEFEDKK